MHGDMRALHDGADAHGEFLAALVAPVPARPHRLATERRDSIECPAMRAVRPIRPTYRLERYARGVIIVVAGMGKSGWKGHGGYLLAIEGSRSPPLSQGDNCRSFGIRK